MSYFSYCRFLFFFVRSLFFRWGRFRCLSLSFGFVLRFGEGRIQGFLGFFYWKKEFFLKGSQSVFIRGKWSDVVSFRRFLGIISRLRSKCFYVCTRLRSCDVLSIWCELGTCQDLDLRYWFLLFFCIVLGIEFSGVCWIQCSVAGVVGYIYCS